MPDVPEVPAGDRADDAPGGSTSGTTDRSAKNREPAPTSTGSVVRERQQDPPGPPSEPVEGTLPFATPPEGTLPFAPPSEGTLPFGTPTQGTPTQGTPTQGTPPQGTPTQGTVPAGSPGAGVPPWPWWSTPLGGASWGGPPPWYGWGLAGPGFPGGALPAGAGIPTAPVTAPRRPLGWLLVGGVLGAIAMVALGLGIGFSVWGGSAPVAARGGVASPAPRTPPALGSGGFLGVEVAVPSGFAPAPTSTTPRTAPAPSPAAPSTPSVAGAYVVKVVPSSPAARAGIAKGDTITEFATRPVLSALTLRIDVLRKAPGSRVHVGWVTPSGKHESATVTLARRPGTRTVG